MAIEPVAFNSRVHTLFHCYQQCDIVSGKTVVLFIFEPFPVDLFSGIIIRFAKCIFHLLDFHEHIRDMYFMLQNEVVERLAARPGDKRYGRLSIMAQYYCRADKLFEVPSSCFAPRPASCLLQNTWASVP